jgi:membrane dipeptidase
MFTFHHSLDLSEEQQARAAELHTRATVIAGHTDVTPDLASRQRAGEHGGFARVHAPLFERGGISAICDHIAGDAPYLVEYPFKNTQHANRLKFALQAAEAVQREAEDPQGRMLVVNTVADIHRAKAEGRIGFIQCLEGAGALEDDPSMLSTFHRLGVRIVGLTHDFRNLFADGVRTGGGGGLTSLGRDLLAEMKRLGVIVDVSHLSSAGFWEVVESGGQPIHASHSNAMALCDVPRNLTDDQIRAIGETGGVIGVHALQALLTVESRTPTLDDMLDHIDHLVELIGDEHVAIGPDLMDIWPAEDYQRVWRETRIPTIDFVYPTGFTSYADFPNLTAGLVRRGYSDEAILNVMGGSLLTLFERVWGPSPTPVSDAIAQR